MFKDENRHYSLRKLSVGLASVLIGISFASGNNHTVKADTVDDGSNGAQAVVQTTANDSNAVVKDHDVAAAANAKDDANTAAKANAESTPKEQSQTPEAAKKDSGAITQDIRQKTVKVSEAVTKVQNKAVKDNSDETTLNTKGSKAIAENMPKEGKTEVKENQGWTDPAKNKLQMSTVRSTTSKRLNAKMLAVSKVVSQANDTNGGFDSSWGKLDVNDWKGSVKGDYYQLTDYTGDANHIIVPNEADFTKAGISTAGKQVGVTSDLMHTIFRDKTVAQDATVAFSKTGNKQVKAIDANWYDTWGHNDDYINDSWIHSKGTLTKFDGSNLDVANVTDMNYMFYNNQISDLSSLANWKTDNVTNMRNMFNNNNISDLSPLANWKTDNVTNMRNMFNNNNISDLSPLTNWKTDSVTNMSDMFNRNKISGLSPLANWKTDNVTDMSNMFYNNHISDLSSLANWKTDNVTNMRNMFNNNNISDLSSLANWKTDNVTDMSAMFYNNSISDLSPLANWKTDNVTDMNWMFADNHINNLSPLANWKTDNVTDMSNMFYNNRISDLSPLANWKTDNVTDMNWMFADNHINNLSPLANWKTDNVTDMSNTFVSNQISNLNPLSNWKTDNVTDMSGMFNSNRISDLSSLTNWNVNNVTNMRGMFESNQISDLSSLSSWKTDNVTDMTSMFYGNQISNISPLANWKVDKVTNMSKMFDNNVTTQTKTIQAKRVINFVYPDGYTGKKQDSVTQTVDVPQKVDVRLITKDSKPSNNILDWATKKEMPEDPDPVYFQDYTVPEIKGLLEPDKTVISKQRANANKPINVTVTYKFVVSNTNDAFALDSKNGLHEHINVNDNGGYDADYWGKINVNDWDYTVNGNTITINSYKGKNPASLIIPNGADFGFINGQDTNNSHVEISSDVMRDLAENATRIGLSKTANNKVIASDAYWRSTFGFGIRKLTQMDLHNLNTSQIINMAWMFEDESNLTTIGDLSEWDTSQVTNMAEMFDGASRLIDLGDLSKWDTSQVTNMAQMFDGASNLTNIGDLSKWDTSQVDEMYYMFRDASKLTDIGDLSNWNTSKVIDMAGMFANASRLTNIGKLDNWNTSKVDDMSRMFVNASSLTNIGKLDNWNTSQVTNMAGMFANASSLTNLGDLSKWDTRQVAKVAGMFYNTKALRYLNISNWDLTNLSHVVTRNLMMMMMTTNPGISGPQDNLKYFIAGMFVNDPDLTVIANDVKLPAWYQTVITDAKDVWNNHMAVITNVPELIKSTGAIDNLKIDDQDASRSIFYDSKGSSDAIQVLKDADQAYISKYEQDHPNYLLALDASVDQTNPIALANAKFKTSHKLIDVVQTNNATRTIIVHLPNGTMQTIVQTIGLKRNAQKDLVTEIISSTAPWGLDEANSSYTINGIKQTQTAYKPNSNIITFSSIKLPKVPGYKANVTRNNGLLMVNYLVFAPEKPATNNNLNELQFSNKLATNSTVKSNIVVKSDMYQVANDDHNWQLPVIKSYDLKFATNKNQIIFAYTKDKQYNYRFVLTFKDGQYRLTTFNKQGKSLKTYLIKSYKKLVKIIHSLISMSIA